MSREILNKVLAAHSGRLAGDGVAATDLSDLVGAIGDWSGWYAAWAALGDRYEARAEECLAEGSHVSAGEFFWQASLAYQYAQFLWFHDPGKREEGQRRKEDLYRRAAPYLQPPAERFDLPVAGTTIPGYLRLPEGPGPFGCVILLGGLESTKEESYLFEQMCLRRGLATCTFDGPGQGEMFFQVGLKEDFETYCARVLEFLLERKEIAGDRIGILGRSLGGYYAARCAALDDRLKACVCWGALYDLSWWDGIPPLTRDGFVYVTKIADRERAVAFLQKAVNLDGLLAGLRCPLYVLHGGRDTVIPGNQVEKLREGARNTAELTLRLEPEGNHCCHNMYPIVRPRMADWLALKLAGWSK